MALSAAVSTPLPATSPTSSASLAVADLPSPVHVAAGGLVPPPARTAAPAPTRRAVGQRVGHEPARQGAGDAPLAIEVHGVRHRAGRAAGQAAEQLRRPSPPNGSPDVLNAESTPNRRGPSATGTWIAPPSTCGTRERATSATVPMEGSHSIGRTRGGRRHPRCCERVSTARSAPTSSSAWATTWCSTSGDLERRRGVLRGPLEQELLALAGRLGGAELGAFAGQGGQVGECRTRLRGRRARAAAPDPATPPRAARGCGRAACARGRRSWMPGPGRPRPRRRSLARASSSTWARRTPAASHESTRTRNSGCARSSTVSTRPGLAGSKARLR